MTDDQFHDHIEAAAYSAPDERPAPDLAALLREVAGLVDWLEIIDKEVYIESRYGCPMSIVSDTFSVAIKLFHRDLLGAICADCDHRKWDTHIWTEFGHTQGDYHAWIYNKGEGEDATEGHSYESRCHAALIAYRDALRAAAVCPGCNGKGEVWVEELSYGGIPGFAHCYDCDGTGKAAAEVLNDPQSDRDDL